jgi:hypothetical protein
MSRAGEVVVGKDLLPAAELSPHPDDVRVVDSDRDAAILCLAAGGRSVVETADLVAVLAGHCRGPGIQGKRSLVLSQWLRHALGRSTGFSPRQVEWYLRLACASPEERERVARAETLSAAVRMLGWATPSPRKAAAVGTSGTVTLTMRVVEAVREDTALTCADREVIAGLLRAALALVEQRNVCAPENDQDANARRSRSSRNCAM